MKPGSKIAHGHREKENIPKSKRGENIEKGNT
jgi:hypothetical protein